MQSLCFTLCLLGASAQMLGSFLNMGSEVTFASVQQQELDAVKQEMPDPCKSITCPDLKCPATFVIADEVGHCCSYCVPSNPALIKDTKDYSAQARDAYATYKTATYR